MFYNKTRPLRWLEIEAASVLILCVRHFAAQKHLATSLAVRHEQIRFFKCNVTFGLLRIKGYKRCKRNVKKIASLATLLLVNG